MNSTFKYNYTVAVVIPNWNGEKYLPAMLDSLLAQTFEDFRVFVVDDQSTDESIDILKGYSKKDDRINFIVRDREPKGAQTCRNIGVGFTEGAKYLVILDNDDYVAPYCLSQRVAFMEEHTGTDFAIFPALCFKNYPFDMDERVWGCCFVEDTLQAMLHWTLPMVGWTNIYRREAYVGYQLEWDERIKVMQDSDFNIQALIKGLNFTYAENAKPDYFYRMVSQSTSTKLYRQESFDSYILLVEKLLSGLSILQIHQYASDLRCYVVRFATIMVNSPSHLFILARLSRNSGQWWFSFRLRIWSLIPHRFRLLKCFLGNEINMIESHQQKWNEQSNKKALEFIDKYK